MNRPKFNAAMVKLVRPGLGIVSPALLITYDGLGITVLGWCGVNGPTCASL